MINTSQLLRILRTFIMKQLIFDFGLRGLCPEVDGLHFVNTVLMCSQCLHSHKSLLISISIYLCFGFLHKHLNLNVSKK